MRHRADFLAAAAAAKASGAAFTLQARARDDAGPPRVGFTVSKKVGNAVERNRVRRRLREIVRLADAGKLHAGHDYVLIGRRAALDARFGDMVQELDAALNRIHGIEPERTGGAAQPHLHDARQKASKRAPSRTRRRIPPMPEL